MRIVLKESYPNVLAQRYASTPLVNIWGPRRKVIEERKLWVAALKAQREWGPEISEISEQAIADYTRVIEEVDFASIKAREEVTRQDVIARAEEFNHLAGHDLCHRGFTSRDETDNVEQLLIRLSLLHVRDRTVALLSRFDRRMKKFAILQMCGRSHNVPGQITTLGKRFATWAEELLVAFDRLEHLIQTYPIRGIKGPMGTQLDTTLLMGSPEAALTLEKKIMEHLGFERVFTSVGQVYPRSLDFEVVSCLVQLASALGNFAKTIRLMAGNELAHEGFKEGQSGSSIMPHKINSRTCERINGLVNVLAGYLDMVSRLVGDQWNEGDVSCSVVRRVALPDAFFALDGIYESAMTVLDEMEIFPTMIAAELERFGPFLATSSLITAAMQQGMGRAAAHSTIKKHAIPAVTSIREGKPNTFAESLIESRELPLDRERIRQVIRTRNAGLAEIQVKAISKKILAVKEKYPEAAAYNPEPIL